MLFVEAHEREILPGYQPIHGVLIKRKKPSCVQSNEDELALCSFDPKDEEAILHSGCTFEAQTLTTPPIFPTQALDRMKCKVTTQTGPREIQS